MTSNTGIEYINLKQAKYNRDRRMAQINAENVKAMQQTAQPGYAKSVPVNIPVDDGLTFKEITGAIKDVIAGKIAEKRKKAARERANSTKYVAKYVKSNKAFPVSVIGYIAVFSVIGIFLVMGNTRINDATLRANELKNEIASEVNMGEILSSSLNQRKDAAQVEEYAVNVLGLVKSTDVAKRYVSISGEDKIVVSGGNIVSGNTTDASIMLDSIN